MRQITGWIVVGVLALSFMGKEAQALDTKSWFVCGGTAFNTCAAVVLNVGPVIDGVSHVEMKVWNLSGSFDSPYGTVFTKIGFFNTVSTATGISPIRRCSSWGRTAPTGNRPNASLVGVVRTAPLYPSRVPGFFSVRDLPAWLWWATGVASKRTS